MLAATLRTVASCMLALPIGACAAQPTIVPGKLHEVRAHPLLPYQIHEECVKLVAGDRLEYSFEAQAPLDFNIRYHEGKAVIMPLSRERAKSDQDQFNVLLAHEYCLMWEAGAQGTQLDYRVRVIRNAK